MKRLFLLTALTLLGQPANWPGVLETDVKAGSWDAATRVGQAVAEEIDAGRMFARFSDAAAEAKVRQLYAQALDHTGNLQQAALQRCMARQILDPVAGAPCAPQAAAERAWRIGNLKADLLAEKIDQPSAPLPFPQDGKVLVVAFWADWCAPCVRELGLLRSYSNSEARVLPVDIDRLNAEVKRRFVPPDSLEGPEIPQLYVFDTQGHIRFHWRGFDDDGFFAQKLDWMVEAALK